MKEKLIELMNKRNIQEITEKEFFMQINKEIINPTSGEDKIREVICKALIDNYVEVRKHIGAIAKIDELEIKLYSKVNEEGVNFSISLIDLDYVYEERRKIYE